MTKDENKMDKMKIDFEKGNGLVPVIIQHYITNTVLMLGYMNEDALQKTKEIGKATFFSRSKSCSRTFSDVAESNSARIIHAAASHTPCFLASSKGTSVNQFSRKA